MTAGLVSKITNNNESNQQTTPNLDDLFNKNNHKPNEIGVATNWVNPFITRFRVTTSTTTSLTTPTTTVITTEEIDDEITKTTKKSKKTTTTMTSKTKTTSKRSKKHKTSTSRNIEKRSILAYL